MIGLLLGLAAAAGPTDPDTQRWWALTTELSSDAMQGRDTGSPAYDRAAELVAKRFAAAGIKPLGEKGWMQPVPMEELRVESASFAVGGKPMAYLKEITVTPSEAMPESLSAPLAYRGYCAAEALGDVKGKIVICHGTHRAGLPSEAQRQAAVKAAGAVGIVTIADPGFAVEPPRWPYAYARAVRLSEDKPTTETMLRLTLKAESLGQLIVGSGKDAAALIADGSAGKPLPSFDVGAELSAKFTLSKRHIVSANVVGILPGTDPAKADQAIVLSAHLDGYGPGEPVNGDGMYNGTLDDAAYVALIERLAERRAGKSYARPVIVAAFTGEEKGLLGARYFVAHPTLPKAKIAADVNLDQLRPIFPLELLTVHGLDDSTLGDDVRVVTSAMGVQVQKDPEPERNLLRRADQWPFMQAGIPGTAFVFGYKPGSESEKIYRQWYRVGYHRPQDDLNQPINWKAAADFNGFFYKLVDKVADQPGAPAWKADSKLKP